MPCERPDIQELLLGLVAGELALDDRERAVAHCAGCNECARERRVLEILAAETVPDPGDVFWASFPDQVHREIERQRPERAPWSRIVPALLRPRLVLAATAALCLIIAGWLMLRPAPSGQMIATGSSLPERDEFYPAETASLSELEPSEVDEISGWASEELRSLGAPLLDVNYVAATEDAGLDELISDLNQRELNGLLTELQNRSGGAS
jgi:anti-sigma factor RsiW